MECRSSPGATSSIPMVPRPVHVANFMLVIVTSLATYFLVTHVGMLFLQGRRVEESTLRIFDSNHGDGIHTRSEHKTADSDASRFVGRTQDTIKKGVVIEPITVNPIHANFSRIIPTKPSMVFL